MTDLSFRERLTKNAEDFDQIVSELLSENEELKAEANWLLALENAGVDNWSGFSYAVELAEEMKAEGVKVAGV